MSNEIMPLSPYPFAELTNVNSSNTEKDKDIQKLRKVCQDFESLFVAQIMRSMRSSVEKSGLFGNSAGADMYESMFDLEVSAKIARSGGLGLSDMMLKSLSEKLSDIGLAEQLFNNTMNANASDHSPQAKESLIKRIGQYHGLISEAAEKHGLPVHLIYGVIAQESSGNPYVVSRVGAKGLMQLMDGTANELGVGDPFDPQENIFGGVAYLREQLQRFNGDVELALAAYNAGPHNVEKYGGIPPFDETQNYVKKVLGYAQEFESKMKSVENIQRGEADI